MAERIAWRGSAESAMRNVHHACAVGAMHGMACAVRKMEDAEGGGSIRLSSVRLR